VSVDDTGARHAGKNGFCTQIGNDWFTWFGTRVSKSRLNFLDLLRAGHTDYVLNDAAYGYMRKHSLSALLIARLMAEAETRFADQTAWLAHLERLSFTRPPGHRPGRDGMNTLTGRITNQLKIRVRHVPRRGAHHAGSAGPATGQKSRSRVRQTDRRAISVAHAEQRPKPNQSSE
jgi:hypothetical protein